MSWSFCMKAPCQASDGTQITALEAQVRALEGEGAGILPADQAKGFAATIFNEAGHAGLQITAAGRTTSHTNAFFIERAQSLSLQAREPQLLDFLRNIASSNSPLRVRALSLRPNAERQSLLVSLTVVGTYRLQPTGTSQAKESSEAEYLVLNERRTLRHAALDCYTAAKKNLPTGWTLESLNFEGGKRLSLAGQAPPNQAAVLEEIKTSLQNAKGSDGEVLFSPSEAEAMFRIADSHINWTMQLSLQPTK